MTFSSLTAPNGHKEVPMEIRFTASVIEAIDCVLSLQHGMGYLPKGADIHDSNARAQTVRPIWCNFDFFSRIEASPVRRTKRVEPADGRRGVWRLERTVDFYYAGERVAAVHLIGEKIDGEKNADNNAFWAWNRIGYFRAAGNGESNPAHDWIEFEREVVSLTGRFVR